MFVVGILVEGESANAQSCPNEGFLGVDGLVIANQGDDDFDGRVLRCNSSGNTVQIGDTDDSFINIGERASSANGGTDGTDVTVQIGDDAGDILNVTGTSTFTGPVTVNGNTDLNGTLDVDGFTQLDGLNVDGATTLDATTIDGTATVNGFTDLNGNVDVQNDLTVGGFTTLNNGLAVNNNNITVTGGNINTNQSVNAGVNVNADQDVTAGRNVSAVNNVNAGNNVNATNNVEAGLDVNAGRNVSAVNNINAGNNVNVGNNLQVTQDAFVGRNAVIDGSTTLGDSAGDNLTVNAGNVFFNNLPSSSSTDLLVIESDGRVGVNNNIIDDLRSGIAATIAMDNAEAELRPGHRFGIGVGFGVYEDETAIGTSGKFLFTDPNSTGTAVTFKASAGFGLTTDSFAAGAGLGFSF